MARQGYPAEFRRRVLDLIESGRKIADVATDLGISDQTIYSWRRQDRIDRGLEPGLATGERAELIASRSPGPCSSCKGRQPRPSWRMLIPDQPAEDR